MVLLHVLCRLVGKHGWMLAVAHFNHLLRGGSSDADAEFVRLAAAQLGLKFISEQRDVQQFARAHKLSVEMAARNLRHDFLARTCLTLGIKTMALAHHSDDQVELFFLRMFRGAGGEGLAGMRWSGPSPSDETIEVVRPLLGLLKDDLQSFAKEEHIEFRSDETNAQLDIERNRIRHELLPLIRERYQPALVKTALRSMEIIGTESDFVRESARSWEHRKNDIAFDHLHPAVQRQWLQMELLKLEIIPEFDLIERLRSESGRVIMLSPGLTIWRDHQGNIQSHAVSSVAFDADQRTVDLSAKEGQTSFGGVTITWQIEECRTSSEAVPNAVAGCECFDARKVGSPIVLRHWRPGDRFHPIGMNTPVKLQNLFTNEKIPRERRHELVVTATARGDIFWVEGLRMSAQFKLDNQTVSGLKWTWGRE